jgi:hypothetical protein
MFVFLFVELNLFVGKFFLHLFNYASEKRNETHLNVGVDF